ncbi:hypothetical protein [Kiloniella sp. b19]|uniref:hypothetical protein n=1 Tax=Kiloniella sp. GXU_MW_B19 TaxID=3141326 RepID=UPI0031DF9053
MKTKLALLLSTLLLSACQTVKNDPVEIAERDCPVRFDDAGYYEKTESFCQYGLYSDNSGKWYTTAWTFENNNLHWGETILQTLPSFYYWKRDTAYTTDDVKSWNEFKDHQITNVQTVSCNSSYTCFSFQHPVQNVSCVYFGKNDNKGLPGGGAEGNNRFEGYFCSPELASGNASAETSKFLGAIHGE